MRPCVGIALACAALAVAATPSFGATGPPKSGPTKLWSEFPPGKQRLQTVPSRVPTGPTTTQAREPPRQTPQPPPFRPSPTPPSAGADRAGPPISVLLAAVGFGLIALGALGLYSTRRPGSRHPAAPAPRARSGGERAQALRTQVAEIALQLQPPPLAAPARPVASAPKGCDKYPTSYPQDRPQPRRGSLSTQSEHTEPETGATPETAEKAADEATAAPRDYADFGSRVAGILDAAEQTAEQIRAEARDDAAAMRQEAEQAAAARREQVDKEIEKQRSDADNYAAEVRKAGETYATQHRREAEEQASKTLQDAEGQARATREAAEEMAARIERAARERQQKLQEADRSVEARLQRALSGLREMTSQLEELLGPQPEQQNEQASQQSIVEALEPRRPIQSA